MLNEAFIAVYSDEPLWSLVIIIIRDHKTNLFYDNSECLIRDKHPGDMTQILKGASKAKTNDSW